MTKKRLWDTLFTACNCSVPLWDTFSIEQLLQFPKWLKLTILNLGGPLWKTDFMM